MVFVLGMDHDSFSQELFQGLYYVEAGGGGILGSFTDGPYFESGFHPDLGKPNRELYRYSRVFQYKDMHLRVASTKNGTNNDTVLHDSYLTIDVHVDPPRVILVDKPTEYSTWSIEGLVPGRDSSAGYIRNLNPEGRELWLSWSTIRVPIKLQEGNAALRLPSLSHKKDSIFTIRRFGSIGK